MGDWIPGLHWNPAQDAGNAVGDFAGGVLGGIVPWLILIILVLAGAWMVAS